MLYAPTAKPMSEKIIEAIVGAAGALLGGIIVYLSTRLKNRADAADMVTDAALSLLDPLKTRLTELEQKMARQETEISRLRRQLTHYADRVIVLMRGIATLIKQIGDLGAKPYWEPDEWRVGDGDEPK